MSFPTTGILDTFVRANGALGSNWQSPVSVDSQTLTIASNAVQATSSGAGMATWKASAFSTKIEAYAKISVLPGSGNYVGVSILDDPAVPSNAYVLEVTQPSSWALYTYASGAVTATYTGTQTLSAGDWIGLYATHGSQIAYYSHDGVTWTPIITSTDTALTVGSWYSAMEIARATGRISQFGGGTTVTAKTVTLSATLAVTDTVSATAARTTFLAADLPVTSATSAAATRETFLAATVPVTDTVQATVSRETFLTGELAGTAAVTAALDGSSPAPPAGHSQNAVLVAVLL